MKSIGPTNLTIEKNTKYGVMVTTWKTLYLVKLGIRSYSALSEPFDLFIQQNEAARTVLCFKQLLRLFSIVLKSFRFENTFIVLHTNDLLGYQRQRSAQLLHYSKMKQLLSCFQQFCYAVTKFPTAWFVSEQGYRVMGQNCTPTAGFCQYFFLSINKVSVNIFHTQSCYSWCKDQECCGYYIEKVSTLFNGDMHHKDVTVFFIVWIFSSRANHCATSL